MFPYLLSRGNCRTLSMLFPITLKIIERNSSWHLVSASFEDKRLDEFSLTRRLMKNLFLSIIYYKIYSDLYWNRHREVPITPLLYKLLLNCSVTICALARNQNKASFETGRYCMNYSIENKNGCNGATYPDRIYDFFAKTAEKAVFI